MALEEFVYFWVLLTDQRNMKLGNKMECKESLSRDLKYLVKVFFKTRNIPFKVALCYDLNRGIEGIIEDLMFSVNSIKEFPALYDLLVLHIFQTSWKILL